MAIAANALIEFFGSQSTVTTTGGQVVEAAFVAAGANWTNSDDAPEAGAVLVCQWATETGIAGKPINLYGRLHDIQSTTDAPVPSATNPVVFLGSFIAPANTASTDLFMPLASGRMRLPNQYTSQVIEFYIENRTGQTIATNWKLYVTPVTVGPHPA